MPASVRSLRHRLAVPPSDGSFSDAEVAGLPAPVQRYLRAAIEPGTPLARAAVVRMRGEIRLGKRWLPFRGEEVIAPHDGFVWTAAVTGGIKGWDAYADGEGRMRWRFLGVVPVMSAKGPNVSRSGAGRAGAEACWVPTTLLPRFGVEWLAEGDDLLLARYQLDDVPLDVLYRTEGDQPAAVTFDRVGDPDGSGEFGVHPFGVEVSEHRTFDGVTIPSSAECGWFHGTDRWDEGRFFRYTISNLELVR